MRVWWETWSHKAGRKSEDPCGEGAVVEIGQRRGWKGLDLEALGLWVGAAHGRNSTMCVPRSLNLPPPHSVSWAKWQRRLTTLWG